MHGTSHVSVLSFGRTGIVTLTRAPHITEDIAPAVSIVFKSLLKHFVDEPVMIDAHNARYASASSVELAVVPLNSQFMDEYIRAIEKLGKPSHSSKGVLAGSAATELYNSIGRPLDLGPGNINFVVFQFNEFKKGMLQFNANNMLPSFGRRLKHYIKSKYGIDTEVYTTDTHFVNALNRSADNVLGRHTRIDKLLPYVDNVVQQAMKGLEPVTVYYSKEQIKNFAVWGANSREKIMAVMDSVIYIAKILVPLIIIGGFVVAAWLISII
jgi:predicted neutral ceramidase superfamily lipid hydrolase